MPSYKVTLRDKTELRITADDVDLEDEDTDFAWYNFLKMRPEEESNLTIAAVPFELVQSITS